MLNKEKKIMDKLKQKYIENKKNNNSIHNNTAKQEENVNQPLIQQQTSHSCSECLKSFQKSQQLQQHLLEKHSQQLFKCSICKVIFDSKENLQLHLVLKHSGEQSVFRCSQCSNCIFHSQNDCQVHLQMYHSNSLLPHFSFSPGQPSFNSNQPYISNKLLTSNQPPFTSNPPPFIPNPPPLTSNPPPFTPNPPPFTSNQPLFTSNLSLNSSPALKDASKAHKCLYCRETFSSNELLLCHLSSQHHQCSSCKQTFHAEILLQKHQRNCPPSHDRTNVFQKSTKPLEASLFPLPALKLPFSYFSHQKCSPIEHHSYHSHQNHQGHTIHNSHLYDTTCSYCKQALKSRGELEKHFKLHHILPNNQKCNICDQVCSSSVALAEHKLTHCKVVESTQCTVCKLDLSTQQQFFDHCHDHSHQGNSMQCVVCRQTLSSALEMDLHGKHHFKGEKARSFKCVVCCGPIEDLDEAGNMGECLEGSMRTCLKCFSKYFIRLAGLKEEDCQASKTFQCIKCQMSFSSEYDIQVHVTSHLLKEGSKQECRLCGQDFDSPAKLQLHLVEHSFDQASSMQCFLCSQTFSSAASIFDHVMNEHGSSFKKHLCQLCLLSFFFSAELTNHMLTCHPNDNSPSPYGFHSSPESDRSSFHSFNAESSNQSKAFLKLARSEAQMDFFKSFHYSLRGKVLERTTTDSKCEKPCPICGGRFLKASDLAHHISKIHKISLDFKDMPLNPHLSPGMNSNFRNLSFDFRNGAINFDFREMEVISDLREKISVKKEVDEEEVLPDTTNCDAA